jgi:transposase
MIGHRHVLMMWQGRLEGLLARHWPEATRVLKLSSATLLRVLQHYGSPQAVTADPKAAERVARWGGKFLGAAKVANVLAGARASVGVRPGEWEQRQLQEYAAQALQARQQGERGQRRLRALARGHAVLEAQGKVVGLPTACVLWVSTGDPRNYHAAPAYRKAMGLNLVERSSGIYQGQLRISKRGSARARQWLYFAALRLVQQAGVRGWYEAKKARNPDDAKRALVAVMRKLALALYHVGVQNKEFDPGRLFAGIASRASSSRSSAELGVEG